MTEAQILIGDVVELSPTKMSTLDDLDLEICTVLEVDRPGRRMKVVFNNNDQDNETHFSNENPVDWFSTSHVIEVERDYKITGITDNQDTVTNQPVTILKMAPVLKQVSHTAAGYKITGAVNEQNTETFIFVGIPYVDLVGYMGETKRICFSKFKSEDVVINGLTTKVWYANTKISTVEDVFVVA